MDNTACLITCWVTQWLSPVLTTWAGIWLSDFLRYLMPTALSYLGLWWLFRAWSMSRLLGTAPPTRKQITREFENSMLTVVIFSLNGLGIVAMAQFGFVEIYRDVPVYGWAWWWASLLILIVGHDIYFYAIHRMLHRPWWFKRVHRVHHQSVHPTVWAAYSFHPVEAALMALYLPLVLVFLPLHAGVIFLFLVHMIVRNVLGHCGVALTGRGIFGRWWSRWCVTSLHHDLHHSRGHGNYCLYFRMLDRWFGTEINIYADRLARHFTHTDKLASQGAQHD